MKVRAWKSGPLSEHDPTYWISIQPYDAEAGRFKPPWVLQIETARAIFGSVVDEIEERHRDIKLTMTL